MQEEPNNHWAARLPQAAQGSPGHPADVLKGCAGLQAAQQAQRARWVPAAAVAEHKVEAGLGDGAHQRRQHLHAAAQAQRRRDMRRQNDAPKCIAKGS